MLNNLIVVVRTIYTYVNIPIGYEPGDAQWFHSDGADRHAEQSSMQSEL